VELRILGPLEVVERNRVLPLGGSRQRALLALLLTRANEVVSADRLIDELWPEDPPQNAVNALQYHVSQLRKTLGGTEAIVTQPPGYVIRVGPNELDLLHFERLVDEAEQAPPEVAARLLREALGLWRGPPLADVAHESFAQTEVVRLEEIRLRALELRVEADLALGRHRELVGELETLVRENPLRERPRAALMRALYGAGRQAEALDVYRQTREMLVDELGIEPSPALQELERAILRQDPSLVSREAVAIGTASRRAIVVVVRDASRSGDLLAIAEPLARRPSRELMLVHLVSGGDELSEANAMLAGLRHDLAARGVSARVAAYTTLEPGDDAALLAAEHDADLVLVDAPVRLVDDSHIDDDLATILAHAPCDVGVLTGSGTPPSGPVVTPFGGIEHDWSAIEIAAWLAQSLQTTLRLLGTEADPAAGRRDASRLLARASLLVQQVVGIATEPVLVPPGEQGVLEAARDARLLVVGLSDRWPTEGIGHVRRAVAAGAGVPTLFTRRGVRPTGVAAYATLTRFSWTLTSPADALVEPPERNPS
jgi:DNA-binding SARP family transcriptional activator